jgi:hypothetical protein
MKEVGCGVLLRARSGAERKAAQATIVSGSRHAKSKSFRES